MKIRNFAAPAALLILAACAEKDIIGGLQPAGYLNDAPKMVAEADWNSPEVVTVTLTNFAFTPNELYFHQGRPTRLILKNTSDDEHTFVSPGFFQAIAVDRIVGPGGVEPGPYLEKVVIPAGQTKEVWFIPGDYGAWNFECTKFGHALLGMKGLVNVVQ